MKHLFWFLTILVVPMVILFTSFSALNAVWIWIGIYLFLLTFCGYLLSEIAALKQQMNDLKNPRGRKAEHLIDSIVKPWKMNWLRSSLHRRDRHRKKHK